MLGSLLMVEACSDTDRELVEFGSETVDPPEESVEHDRTYVRNLSAVNKHIKAPQHYLCTV